jgi:hypothetical protein
VAVQRGEDVDDKRIWCLLKQGVRNGSKAARMNLGWHQTAIRRMVA